MLAACIDLRIHAPQICKYTGLTFVMPNGVKIYMQTEFSVY